MFFDILTLFPAMFDGAFSDSIISRACQRGIVSITVRNIRDFSSDDRRGTVDDYPYGGDAGMLMKPEPVIAAIKASTEKFHEHDPKVIYLSPQGELLTQAVINTLITEKALIILCGRYKGIDQRVCDRYVDREISIGDYVLSGGEIPAMVIVDSLTRLLPGVLGNRESAEADSFYNGLLSHPQYTRPEVFEGMAVPPVLLSGNHAQIRQWQREQSMEITRKLRPDLWERYKATDQKIDS